ncbi:MAG: hypothetical protein MRZ75_04670 [Roseburia sp.]|uniref:hypothetical protein n=1 Tax=Roseburia sp. 831b TaxID=1261635 RepID=UPI0013563B4C|nr:hypothetical protein [Roseburia sp. 831b]MCI5918613.1 hypothetical protein [Roseburia sp.]MDY5882519.1 hypothetical protein [Roseburia sp.]WVK73903.1 hypothetical protein BIV16_05125 [Roseburia sp. 831b]
MIIIDDKSVYEIDEECVRRRKVPLECKLPIQRKEKEKQNITEKNGWKNKGRQ